jgi:uncharacterized protein involved in outer membrane biogenesis
VLALLGYFTYTPIISHLIGDQLGNAVNTRLHAELQYDSLTYIFPYGVRIQNARLHTDPSFGNENLLTIEHLDLHLAELPLPHRPVVIQTIELRSPALHVVRATSGIEGTSGIERTDEEQQQHPPTHRLSEMFELRKFVISDGSVSYEDRTVPNTEPLVFRGVTADLGVTPQSKALYACELRANEAPFAGLSASGTIDIDALVIQLKQLAMTVESKPVNGESALPPKLQRSLNELDIHGKLSITGSGEWPLRDRSRSWFQADMKLADARAAMPAGQGTVDPLTATATTEFRDGKFWLDVNQLDGKVLGGTINGRGKIDGPGYDLDLNLSNIDVSQIPAHPGKLTGEGTLNIHLSGMFARDPSRAQNSLAGKGEAQITHGRLTEADWLSEIAQRTGIARDSLTTGDAAAVFSIRDSALVIDRGAINTPVLGLQGNGSITFQGDTSLSITAAPLGDWRKKVQGTGIPVLSNVAGAIAAGAQRVVNAGSRYLYAFEVKGKLPHPQVRAVPAPVLTNTASSVFGKMVQDVKSSDLLKSLKEDE